MRNQSIIKQINLRFFFKLVLFFILGSVFSTASGHAANAEKEAEIFLSSSPTDSSVQFIHSVGNGTFPLEQDVTFRMKAYIEPVTVSKKAIYDQKELTISEQRFECRDFPCTKKWEFDLADKNLSIQAFPHLQLVWSQSPFGATPEISVQAEFIPEGTEQKAILINGGFSEKDNLILDPFVTIDMKGVEFTEKSRLYLARRELGLKADPKWRYSMDGQNLVLQSRVDQPLSNIQVVQVISDQDLVPERVQFSVDSTGNGRRDMFILFDQTSHSVEKKDGRSILTLDLRGAVKNLGIDLEKAVLLEPIIFMPTNFQTFMRDKPIRKIIFASADSKDDRKLIVPQMVRKGSRYYLDFDFSKVLEDQSIWGGILKKLMVTARLDGPQVLSMERIRLFDVFEKQIPALTEEPGKAFQSWGGGEMTLGPFERIGSFRPVMWIWQDNKSNKDIWRSSNLAVSGKLWPYFSGSNSLPVEIAIDRQGKKETLPLFLKHDTDFSIPEIGPGTKLMEFKDHGDTFLRGKNKEYELGFFDVKSDNIASEINFETSEWWIKEAEIPLVSRDESVRIDEQKGKVYLLSKEDEKKKWTLTLPDVEFMVPISLLMPGSIPPCCKATLKINGVNISLFEGADEIPLFGDFSHLNEFVLEIEHRGREHFFPINIPRLKVFGMKQTPQDELKKLVLSIGGKKIPIPISKFGDSNGGWVDLGQISLGQGEHFVHLGNTPFFRFKTLILETDAALPWTEDEQTPVVKSSIWEKLFLLGLKLLLVCVAVCILYIFRARVNAGFQFFWRPVCLVFEKVYRLLPDKAWTILWLLGAAGLYGLGLLSKSQGENYATTFAGIFMVVFFWHLGRLMKGWLLRKFPKIGMAVYRSRSTPFFAWAIVLLVLTACLVVVKLEPLAEQTAIIVYYCLVVGVVGEVLELKNQKAETRLTGKA